MKPAFIVIAHQSKEFRINGHQFLQEYLLSLERYMTRDYDVFIVENGSERLYNIQPNKVHYRYIPDQSVGGITRAWNVGVSMAVENGNDVICLTNDDIRFNNSINNLFLVIESLDANVRDNCVFGPVCDNPTTFKYQVANQVENKVENVTGTSVGLHGWFLCFTPNYFSKYSIEGNLFDPKQLWAGQENFQPRDWKKGSKSIIVKSCLVHHHHTGGWKKIIKK